MFSFMFCCLYSDKWFLQEVQVGINCSQLVLSGDLFDLFDVENTDFNHLPILFCSFATNFFLNIFL